MPGELWRKAEGLSEIGVDEVAWHPADVALLLDLLGPTEIAVLGGDVYLKRSGRFEPSHESWYAEPHPSELPAAFAIRSRSIARDYLARLAERGGGPRWVTLVLSEPMAEAPRAEVDSDER